MMMGEKEGGGVFHVCMMIGKRGRRRKLKAGAGANGFQQILSIHVYYLLGILFDGGNL